jgi:hypothetical protein
MIYLTKRSMILIQGGFFSFVLFAAIFFPYFQETGFKWQLAVFPLALTLIFRHQKIELNQIDVVLFICSFCALFFGLFSTLPIHINLSIGLLITIIVSKVEFNETPLIVGATLTLLLHHILTDILPYNSYLSQFNKLNEFYGVNRSAFIFFSLYIYLCHKETKMRFIPAVLTILHSSRLMILSIILIEFFLKNSIRTRLLCLIGTIIVIFYFVEPWILKYYFLNFDDASSNERTERYVSYLIEILENFYFPKMTYGSAPHNIFIELIMYLSLAAPLLFITLIYCANSKLLILFMSFAFMGPKTLHDLLIFYLLLGWLIKLSLKETKPIRLS